MKALISVFDKTGLIDFARGLQKLGIELVATGGTAEALQKENIIVTSVTAITGFPEIMGGRVKTLHPIIMGGILGKRDQHQPEAQKHNIPWFDLVVCNLYPFAAVIEDKTASFEKIIENIDIGGPTMIRAAAKNHTWTTVVVNPKDYGEILEELQTNNVINLATRQRLAADAFAYTAQYDAIIADYLVKDLYPQKITLPLEKAATLRYGENPHQKANVYKYCGHNHGLLSAKQHQGKQLSFNNLLDADAALRCVLEFTHPTCVIVKHAMPCGVATAKTIDTAFTSAWAADSLSAFGGIIALNQPCTAAIAEHIKKVFVEIVIAPSYEPQALTILQNKTELRILEVGDLKNIIQAKYAFKPLADGFLLQDVNNHILSPQNMQCMTQKHPSSEEISNLLFAWQVVKYAKSNAIVIAGIDSADAQVTFGIGQGQVSRVDAMHVAIRKAGEKILGAVIASDGFFPFRDTIDLLASSGVKAIIQPGGSKRDAEVIAACEEHGIALLFSKIRYFYH